MCAGSVRPIPKVLSPKATEEQTVTCPRPPCIKWQIPRQDSACLPSGLSPRLQAALPDSLSSVPL